MARTGGVGDVGRNGVVPGIMQEYEDAGLDCKQAGFCWIELGSEY